MTFSINKNATLPVLKLELLKSTWYQYEAFFDNLQNANIFFTMYDSVTGVKKIARKPTGIELKEPQNDCVGDEYLLTYQFTKNDTNTAGRYVAQFDIEFLDGSGTLVVPIREPLYINILNNDIKK